MTQGHVQRNGWSEQSGILDGLSREWYASCTLLLSNLSSHVLCSGKTIPECGIGIEQTFGTTSAPGSS